MLSGSPEEMKEIEKAGRLDDWRDDNLEWLRKTFGKDNLVSAVLHLDEKTPHIHATVVPVVTGERRKAKAENNNGKKKYKKKNTNIARLCADDVMARDKLTAYQTSHLMLKQWQNTDCSEVLKVRKQGISLRNSITEIYICRMKT